MQYQWKWNACVVAELKTNLQDRKPDKYKIRKIVLVTMVSIFIFFFFLLFQELPFTDILRLMNKHTYHMIQEFEEK